MCVALSVVVLAVLNASARAHALHFARHNHCLVAHTVYVAEAAAQGIAHNFHVAVGVGAKASACGNAVFVNDSQIAKAHVVGVVVIGKAKAVVAFEPAVVDIATVLRTSDSNHGLDMWEILQ